jgi:hypothetical protein
MCKAVQQRYTEKGRKGKERKGKERVRLYGTTRDAVVNGKDSAGLPLLRFGTDAMVRAHPQLAQGSSNQTDQTIDTPPATVYDAFHQLQSKTSSPLLSTMRLMSNLVVQ